MIRCSYCNHQNKDDAHVCVHCGVRLLWSAEGTTPLDTADRPSRRTTPEARLADYIPPPAQWDQGRPPMPVQPLSRTQYPAPQSPHNSPAPPPQGTLYAPPQQFYAPHGYGFRCPYCQSTLPPLVVEDVSTAGWVTLSVMLLFCFPLFWIGLLMKEEYRRCRSCGVRLG